MEKIIIIIINLFLVLSNTVVNIRAKEEGPNYSYEVVYLEPYVEEWKWSIDGETHIIVVNRETNEVTVDGVTLQTISVEVPLTRTTIDYSSRADNTVMIPVTGTAVMISTILTLLPGLQYQVAASIVDIVSAGFYDIYITYSQYKSVENYWSSYYSIYYKKAINRDIRAYRTSVSANNLKYGPVNGSWFDPVRPS